MVQARRDGPWLGWLVVPAGLLAWVSASGFQLWDAMELSGAAWTLGGSHPPGQPLHALLGQRPVCEESGKVPAMSSTCRALRILSEA